MSPWFNIYQYIKKLNACLSFCPVLNLSSICLIDDTIPEEGEAAEGESKKKRKDRKKKGKEVEEEKKKKPSKMVNRGVFHLTVSVPQPNDS